LRLLGAATLGALAWRGRDREVRRRAVERRRLPKLAVSDACVACTGCLAVCPKDAIRLTPRGIVVSDEHCVSCGYCVAACPVGALQVNREVGGA
jgi:Fe-S-cluster-containing dehydrogenase component